MAFLPGSLCDRRLFTHQIDELGHSFAVEVADFSGLTSIESMARRVLDSVPGHLVPIGLSMGGIVAAELIDRAPERITAAALLDTNLDRPARGQLITRRRWANQTRSGQFADVVQEMVPLLTANVEARGELAARMALDAGSSRFLDENEALMNRGRDRRRDLRRFGRPLLFVVGEQDQVCPPELHRDMADSTIDGRLVVVPGAGHLSSIDQPDLVTQALSEWLDAVRSGR